MKRGSRMRLSGFAGMSVERLRWLLLVGVAVLVGVLVVLLSYGRYRAVEAWKQIVKRSGATITHETNGITWSQAVRGKTIFVLHAARAVPHGEGHYTLQDASLVLYDTKGQPANRISGAQFDYDEKDGVAKALGEVDMELELPKTVAGAGGEAKGGQQPIHVRTSGLTYVRKLGVAATDQDVEIDYGAMHGWSKGAEFDSGESVVHLLAGVRAEAQLHGAPVTLNAAKADLDRDADVIDLTAPRVISRDRTATAARAVLHLRKDGSLETVEARGGVTLKQGTRTISAPALNVVMNEDSRAERADLAGGVTLVDTSAVRPMKGSAKTVTIRCDDAGNPTSLVAAGGATMNAAASGSGGVSLARQMGADRLTLTLVKAGRGETRVSAVHAEGNAWADGDAIARSKGKAAGVKSAGIKTTRIAADDLRLVLVRDADGKDVPQSLAATGHTRIAQKLPDGTEQTSGGDSLQATFERAKTGSGVEIASAQQTGHVEIHSVPGNAGKQPSEGVAEQASLDGATDVVTLTGHPRLTSGDTSASAETIRLTQATGDAEAVGNVAATLVNANARPGALTPASKGAGSPEAPVTHVLAQAAVLRRAADTVEFTGTDAAPARMWQGASQVEAANLLLDRAHDAMHAWPQAANGVVRSVFANEGTPRSASPANAATKKEDAQGKLKGDRVARITSGRLDYSGTSHEAVFRGNVMAQAEGGDVRAQYGVAFLAPKQSTAGTNAPSAKGQPNPVASSLDRVVMSGGVKIQQPGRTGTGEQLLYTAATGEFVLTGTAGHPPHVADDKQGSITGETLLFRSPDSTIVVGGAAPGVPGAHRVHTETTIRK